MVRSPTTVRVTRASGGSPSRSRIAAAIRRRTGRSTTAPRPERTRISTFLPGLRLRGIGGLGRGDGGGRLGRGGRIFDARMVDAGQQGAEGALDLVQVVQREVTLVE